MNKECWNSLNSIRKVFEKYPTKRLTSVENRGGYVAEETNQEDNEFDDEFYNSYCRVGSAKYKDE